MRSSAPINALANPRVSDSVRVRSTDDIGILTSRYETPLRLRLGFGQADVGQFRVDEQAIGNHAIARRAIAAVEIAEHDAKIVLAHVGELRTAGTVAHGPNVGGRGLQPLVDSNIAARVQLNTGLADVDSIRVGRSPGRHQNVASLPKFFPHGRREPGS